jgi:hypothetical protein
MNHNKTGVYLTVNKLQLLLCYKYSYLPCLDYYCHWHCGFKTQSVVARRDISQEILVARHKFLVAPGRRAGDFASNDNIHIPHEVIAPVRFSKQI